MYVPCWNCGQDVWIKTQTECRHCGNPAKRCVDCVHYTVATGVCAVRQVHVSEHEAAKPTTLSQSYRCEEYHQSPNAAAQAMGKREQEAAQPAEAAAPTQTVQQRPARVAARPTAPAPRPPAPAAKATRKRPHVIAHRGDPLRAPENTVAAISRAADMGVDSIEFDVHVTADSVPVVIHDATVDRTTNGSGRVVNLEMARIRELDAGSWFDDSFANERVPTLSEAVEAAGRSYMNVHVKCHENESDRAEKAIVKALREADAVDRCWITHHTRHGLHRFRQLEPKLRLCWLPRGGTEDIEYIDDAFYMTYRIIQPSFRVVTPEFVEYAHNKEMWINVFWADEIELMRRLTELGVNGILTNVPNRLQEVVGVGRSESASDR
jgi:glycerophosphoryl diester phosphodiesterase